MTTIAQRKAQLEAMPDAELKSLYRLYNDLKRYGVNDTILLGLIETELYERKELV